MSIIKGRVESKKKRFLVLQNFIKAVRGLNLNHIDEALLVHKNIDYDFLIENNILSFVEDSYLYLFENDKIKYSGDVIDFLIEYDANRLNEIPDRDIFDGGKMKVAFEDDDKQIVYINNLMKNYTEYKYFKFKGKLYNVSEKGAVFMREVN